ncbi:MAG: carbamoyltransferase [Actinobacteria bacterium]|nr:carbamoyltransferase [Actinomycetota bacterium]
MIILGISALYHDAAAALVVDGEIIAAAQEERFTRVKHDLNMPVNAMLYCLKEGNLQDKKIDKVVFYDNPFLILDRFLKNVCALGQNSWDLINRSFNTMFSKKIWIQNAISSVIGDKMKEQKIYIAEHHISHAASAFYPSPFDQAVIVTVDGVGEWATTTVGLGVNNKIEILKQINYPHSLGMLYSAFTFFCGFKVNSGEYKFMGLAPYGQPVYYEKIKQNIIDIKPDGSYRLNLEYFDYQNGRTMIGPAFEKLFDGPRREFESPISKREMDIAASVQKVLEEVLLLMAKDASKTAGSLVKNLVLAGGVALNCVANGKIYKEKIFERVWIQPAAGDAGGALGSALYLSHHVFGEHCKKTGGDLQKGSYLGPSYNESEIRDFLENSGYPYHKYKDIKERNYNIASALNDGKVIGLFQGRMEFGPRALGNRSIIGDARSPQMQSRMNLKIKYRESFRPFAPSVLREKVNEYFELDEASPYMLLVANVNQDRRIPFDIDEQLKKGTNMLPIVNKARSDIPAVTHVDYSARIQTVSDKDNAPYHGLLKYFEDMTGCAVIVNTSFNVRGEPIVCSPKEAYNCFMRTDMDILVLENFLLYKEEQPEFKENENWRDKYELD